MLLSLAEYPDRTRVQDWREQQLAGGMTDLGEVQAALPDLPNAAALLEEDALLLRDGGGQVVSAGAGELAGLVEIACAEHAGDEAARFRLVIYCEPALKGMAQQAMAGLAVQEGIRTVSADIVRGSVPGVTQISLALERRD